MSKIHFIGFGIYCFLLCGFCQAKNERKWKVTDYGAVGDSLTLNTLAIQKAIDACAQSGGGLVIVEKGIFITGTILLKNGVYLKIEKGASLVGSANPQHYLNIDPFVDATGQTRGKCLIGAQDVSDIGIVGEGVIDGVGKEFVGPRIKKIGALQGMAEKEINTLIGNRPFLIRLVRSKGIVIKDIHLRQSAAWMLHLYQCQGVKILGIDIYNHANSNNDGIDIDGSRDIEVNDSKVNSGDDAICLKTTSLMPTEHVRIRNCDLKSEWGAIKIGTESMGDVRQVSVRNCLIRDTRGGGIKLLSVDGANISKVDIRRIRMENVDMPLFIRLGERLRTYRDAPKRPVGSIDKITISKVHATTQNLEDSRVKPPTGIFITGTPNHSLGQITLKSISISLPGGGVDSLNNIQVEEQLERYPEFSFFGPLPAYGIMARHVHTLKLSKVRFSTLQLDRRQVRRLENVTRLLE